MTIMTNYDNDDLRQWLTQTAAATAELFNGSWTVQSAWGSQQTEQK